MQRAGQRADEKGLREARDAFQQRMAASEHRDQHLLDHVVLTNDNFGQLLADAGIGGSTAIDSGDVVGRFSVVRHVAGKRNHGGRGGARREQGKYGKSATAILIKATYRGRA